MITIDLDPNKDRCQLCRPGGSLHDSRISPGTCTDWQFGGCAAAEIRRLEEENAWLCEQYDAMAQIVARLDALLPDQPPPTDGHGDVLLDLAGEDRSLSWSHRLMDRLELLRRAQDQATGAMVILCHVLGVDLRDAILERRRIGIERYGQPLRYGDGRSLVDAAQEAIDLCAYLKREIGP